MFTKIKIEHLFIACMFVLFAGFMAASHKDFASQREMMGVLGHEKLSFYDFQMDSVLQKSIYTEPHIQRVYPPLIYLVDLAIAKNNVSIFFVINEKDHSLTSDGVFIVVLFLMIFSFILFFQLSNLKDGNINIKFLSSIALIFSGIFLHALYSGNLVILITAFLTFFIVNYRNASAIIREAAILSLALAVVGKPYIAFMGILLLFNREWKLLIRAAIYSFLLVFVPFFFVALPPGVLSTGIMDKFFINVFKWLEFMFGYGVGAKLSFPANIGNDVFTPAIRDVLYSIIYAICIVFSIFAVMCAPFLKKKEDEWKKALLMISSFIVLSGGGTTVQYCFIYFFPCIIMFLNSNTKINLSNMIYLIGFVLILNPLQIGKVSGITITWALVKVGFWIVFVHMILDGFIELLKEKDWRKRVWFLNANEKK